MRASADAKKIGPNHGSEKVRGKPEFSLKHRHHHAARNAMKLSKAKQRGEDRDQNSRRSEGRHRRHLTNLQSEL